MNSDAFPSLSGCSETGRSTVHVAAAAVESNGHMATPERLRLHSLHFAVNALRYEGFSPHWRTLQLIVRLLQNYIIFMFPSCKTIWIEEDSASKLLKILDGILRLTWDKEDLGNYVRVDFVLFIFSIATLIFVMVVIRRDPVSCSTSNATLFVMLFVLRLLVPVGAIAVASVGGRSFRAALFQGERDFADILGVIVAAISMGIMIFLRYVGCALVDVCAQLDFDARARPWAANVMTFAHMETYFFILAFCEGILDLDVSGQRIVFTVLTVLVANPFVAAWFMYKPFFQDVHDAPVYAVQFIVGLVSVIIIDIELIWDSLSPASVLCSLIINYGMMYTILRIITQKRIKRYMTKLYMSYKSKVAALSRPLGAWTTNEPQVILSPAAYAIVEAFMSLQIKNVNEYQYYLSVGAVMSVPAVRNGDFIKWGMHPYGDAPTLIMCQQICQCYSEDVSTEQILLQKIHEMQGSAWSTLAMLHCMDLRHADTIIERPFFLKTLVGKARNGYERCRRCLNRFWGCVLLRSPDFMQESLCALRDCISEADVHFNELKRCYPFANSAMALNLLYLTEVKGKFFECHDYMTTAANTFSDKYGVASEIEGERAVAVRNNPTKLFAVHTTHITKYMEQEKLAREIVKKMPRVVWAVTIAASAIILVWLVITIFVIENSFSDHPRLVDIIISANTVITKEISLLLGLKRLCFYGLGISDPWVDFEGCEPLPMSDRNAIVPYLTGIAETLSSDSVAFFRNSSGFNWTSKGLTDYIVGLTGYGNRLYRFEGLGFLLDVWSTMVRNGVSNTPMMFAKEGPDPLYPAKLLDSDESNGAIHSVLDYKDVCRSREMAGVMEDIDSLATVVGMYGDLYVDAGREVSGRLNLFLYFSMSYLPIITIVLYGTFLAIMSFYVHKEANFRLTLFLALPEAVASDLCKGGGLQECGEDVERITSANVTEHSKTVLSATNDTATTTSSMDMSLTPEMEIWEAKRRIVEGLYQTATGNSLVRGVGLRQYMFWYIIYVLCAVATFYWLGQYARGVNEVLLAWSKKICHALKRMVWGQLARLCMDDVFLAAIDPISLHSRDIWSLSGIFSVKFLESTRTPHRLLTYGGSDIPFDFRETETVTEKILLPVSEERPEGMSEQRESFGMLHHSAYRGSGCDLRFELFYLASRGTVQMVGREVENMEQDVRLGIWSGLNLSSSLWQEYEHISAHVLDEMNEITMLYCEDAHSVIDLVMVTSFMVALLTAVVLLFFIFVPMRILSNAIYQYFDTLLHCLLQVPPDVFRSSIYINKWLKGQISRSNYNQYQNTFSRTVPVDIQKGAIAESPEKIMIFDSNGHITNSGSYSDLEINERESKSLSNVIGMAIDTKANVKLVEEIEKIVTRFREARDSAENVILKAPGIDGGFVKLTIAGIVSNDSHDTMIGGIQQYYEYVGILIRDITDDISINEQLRISKERTVRILTQYVPMNVALSLHEGHRDYRFTGEVVSLCLMQLLGYEEMLGIAETRDFSTSVTSFKNYLSAFLGELPSISVISMHSGTTMLAAGLFDEESAGQVEATEMITFCRKMEQLWLKLEESLGIKTTRKYAICTGGPVRYRLLIDTVPQSLVSGTLVSATKALLASCTSGILIDQTTYHCAVDMNLETEQLEDLEFGEEEEEPIQRYKVIWNMNANQNEEEEQGQTARADSV